MITAINGRNDNSHCKNQNEQSSLPKFGNCIHGNQNSRGDMCAGKCSAALFPADVVDEFHQGNKQNPVSEYFVVIGQGAVTGKDDEKCEMGQHHKGQNIDHFVKSLRALRVKD